MGLANKFPLQEIMRQEAGIPEREKEIRLLHYPRLKPPKWLQGAQNSATLIYSYPSSRHHSLEIRNSSP